MDKVYIVVKHIGMIDESVESTIVSVHQSRSDAENAAAAIPGATPHWNSDTDETEVLEFGFTS